MEKSDDQLEEVRDCLFGLIAVLDGFFTAYAEKSGFYNEYTYARDAKWKAMIDTQEEAE